MNDTLTIGIIGCGRMGQAYAEIYHALPDTQLIAIAEHNPERRKIVGERFGVTALFADAHELFADVVPDVAVLILPVKYNKDAVLAASQAGVKGITVEKPIAATLADADAMVESCEQKGIVFGGGNLQRAMHEVQEAACWLHAGEFGSITGASIHDWGGSISGGGCQHISVLRLFVDAEIAQVTAWAKPQEALEGDSDEDLMVNAVFTMTDGLTVPVFGKNTPYKGVDVWTDTSLIRWDWKPPQIYHGFDDAGHRIKLDRPYSTYENSQYSYLGTSIRSFLNAVRHGDKLWISGHDLRQALEAAIAAKHSALWGSVPVPLPLQDRSLSLLPVPYRWLGGDSIGRIQSPQDAAKNRYGVV